MKEKTKARDMKNFDQNKYQDLKELKNEIPALSNVNETFNEFHN